MPIGRLHVITDARPGRDPIAVVRAALSAGTPVIQVRAPSASGRELYDLAVRVLHLCQAHGAQCLVDDRPDVALAVGAAGAHLGADDLPLAATRRMVGPAFILGATARGPDEARARVADGASYLGVGPAFATATKSGLPEPIGVATLAQVVEAVTVPVIAIGGVSAERVPELLAAGVHGVAVVSQVSDAADPAAAVRALLRALGQVAA